MEGVMVDFHVKVNERERDRGQAIVLVLALVVIAVVCAVAMGRFSARLVDKQQAQLAADAAALAGVVGGRAAAERLATANDAVLTDFVVAGDEVIVEVQVRHESAQARATRAP
jgi:NhaP-type Na+/H+ or K+/H+ antiporter